MVPGTPMVGTPSALSAAAPLVGAVAADADKALDAEDAQVLYSLLLVLGLEKSRQRAVRQKRTAAVYLVRHAAGGEYLKIIMLVLAAHEYAICSRALKPMTDISFWRQVRTTARMAAFMPGGVAAGSQYADPFHEQTPSL